MQAIDKITIIGAGNVATHLAIALAERHKVTQILSRKIENARALAKRIPGCQAIDRYDEINIDSDLYLIAVSDDAIADVAAQLPKGIKGVVAHTSGSVPMTALASVSADERQGAPIGVFYPLQTFSKVAKLDVRKVPFFTEASDHETWRKLDELALWIGASVQHANSQQRTILHIAAVFACNFANRLWAIADEMLSKSGYGLDVLRPLMQATLDKALSMPPAQAQTGPAARQDMKTIEKHLAMLPPDLKPMYTLLTQSIIDSKK